MKTKRWIWILAMAPVMWGLLQLVIWADRLHAWQYSPNYAPPATADFTRAAVVFWGTLLTPIFVGLVAAIVAFRRKYPPRWPVLEMTIVAIPYLLLAMGSLTGGLYKSNWVGVAFRHAINGAYLLIGGAVVLALLNMGACVHQRMWGKFALFAVVLSGGMLYLFWLNTFIIYIDT